jgi:hypothetical protein
MQQITAVNNKASIKSAEFVKLTLARTDGGSEVYTFSTSYKPETFGGVTYLALSGLMDISQQQRSLEATQYDTSITLSGVDQQNIFYVLSPLYQIKGSKIEIYRGFYNDNYVLTETALRYTGVITNFNIAETNDSTKQITEYAVSIQCANFKKILEDNIGGIATNSASWKQYFPNDVSMNRIDTLHDRSFDFGKKLPGRAKTQSEIDAENENITGA